ncbi:MAG: type I restriction enzyme endonuclease domain-containing protein [Acidimicrobiales bacterium]
MDASEYKHVVLGLVFLKYIDDAFGERREKLRADLAAEGFGGAEAEELLESRDEYTAEGVFWVPPDARWGHLRAYAKQPEIGKLIDNAMDLVEIDNPTLRGVLPKSFSRPALDVRRLGELVDLVSGIGLGSVEHREKDILGRVYEYFLGRFASAEGKGGGEFYTPRSVVKTLVEMIEPYQGRVYDPCCGSGGMFVQSEHFVEAHEVCCELLYGCPWREALDSGSDRARIEALMEAFDHLLGGAEMDLADRFVHHERRARQAFAICAALPEAAGYRDDMAFFQAVAVEVRRSRATDISGGDNDLETETALRQVVSEAVSASGVVDIYAASGLERPDLSLVGDDFARRAVNDPRPNLQIELLHRLLNSEVRTLAKTNVVAERKFSEMLERAMRAYNNRSLTAAEVIAEMVEMAQQLKFEYDRGADLGLRDDELAFYDAVCQNDSAVMELGDETLKSIAQELVATVRQNTTVDWDKKEQVRAYLRSLIKRLLVKYGYPPDKRESAITLVMDQAERLAAEAVA